MIFNPWSRSEPSVLHFENAEVKVGPEERSVRVPERRAGQC